jgi:signal transduction histidine kinase
MVAVALVGVAMTEVAGGDWPVPTIAGVLWAGAAVVPVVFLRTHPVAAWLSFVGLNSVLVQLLGEPQSAALFFTTVALAFGVGAFTEDRRWLPRLVPTLVLLVGVITFHDRENTRLSQRGPEFVFTLALVALAVGAGALVRRRSLAARAARVDAAVAAEESRLGAERAIAEERARIARDLHDVVAHSVSLMVVQAVGGRGMLSRRPDAATEAFDAISTAGGRALQELHRMLEVLGEDDHRAPGHLGLAAVPEMVAAARQSGVEVSCEIAGPVDALPSGIDVAAYRILQEGLTNAVKHSTSRAATLTVGVTPTLVMLEVTNPVVSPAARVVGSGFGLMGMRERAAVYGGSVQAGIDDGVWSTRATLRIEQ